VRLPILPILTSSAKVHDNYHKTRGSLLKIRVGLRRSVHRDPQKQQFTKARSIHLFQRNLSPCLLAPLKMFVANWVAAIRESRAGSKSSTDAFEFLAIGAKARQSVLALLA
jgi:hypothetical protein